MPHYSEEDLTLIKNLRIEKSWGADKMMAFFPNKPWTRSGVQYIINKVDKTGTADRVNGSGRPRSSRTEENIEIVEGLILSQEDAPGTHRTPREIARETGIHHSSVHRIIHKNLHLNVFKRMEVHELSANDCERRKVCSGQLLNRFPSDASVDRIWFSDEKVFTVASPLNSQNNRVYSAEVKKSDVPAKNLLFERKHFSTKVMVSVAVSATGKTPLIFVEQGVKLNSENYISLLRDQMLPSIVGQSGRRWTFQQDGAPSHRAAATVKFLKAHVPDFIEPQMWPPNSPDLNCVDYSVWGAFEEMVYKNRRIRDVQSLKTALTEEWDRFPQDFIKQTVRQWRPRLEAVLNANGGHIEHLF